MPATDARRVEKVIRLIGVSPTSWEDAAREAVGEAAKTVRELTTARVRQLDVRIGDDGTQLFRVAIEVTFRIDRNRLTPTGHPITVRRILVVGNHTLSQTALTKEITSRRLRGPLEVHVVVPRDPGPLAPLVLGDPSTGVVLAELQIMEIDRAAELEATDRLRRFLDALDRMDIAATGELGPSSPVAAVQQVLTRAVFDEIIVSTLSSSASRWLRLDIPSRLRRLTATPVHHVAAD